jgi:hypothetical protein
MTKKMANTTASRRLITEWADEIQVGIYDNCTWRIRLYADRAVVKMPGVKWVENSGSYHDYHYRITGSDLARLRQIAEKQEADDSDYTEEAFNIASDYYK